MLIDIYPILNSCVFIVLDTCFSVYYFSSSTFNNPFIFLCILPLLQFSLFNIHLINDFNLRSSQNIYPPLRLTHILVQNSFHSKTLIRSGKRRKSIGIKSGEYGGLFRTPDPFILLKVINWYFAASIHCWIIFETVQILLRNSFLVCFRPAISVISKNDYRSRTFQKKKDVITGMNTWFAGLGQSYY